VSGRDFPALGTLRERIELFRKDQSVDLAGGNVEAFVSLGSVWAKVEQKNGTISAIADARSVGIYHNITIRFRTDLNPGDRIIYRSQNLEVISASDLNARKAYLVLKCSQIQVTG